MARPVISASRVPTPGPWIVRGEGEPGAIPEIALFGIEPASDDGPGGFPYLILQDRTFPIGDCPLHLASGIQRLADAKLMAAAPTLADVLLRLLTSSALTRSDLEPAARSARERAWSLLAQVAPHLEIGS